MNHESDYFSVLVIVMNCMLGVVTSVVTVTSDVTVTIVVSGENS